jgi:predicted nucleic acid-binding protein
LIIKLERARYGLEYKAVARSELTIMEYQYKAANSNFEKARAEADQLRRDIDKFREERETLRYLHFLLHTEISGTSVNF